MIVTLPGYFLYYKEKEQTNHLNLIFLQRRGLLSNGMTITSILTVEILLQIYMSQGTAFPTRLHVRPLKSQNSLISPYSQISLHMGTLWVTEDPKRLHADSEESDQSARMRRFIRVFAGQTCNIVGNDVSRLI